jgi:hypothetical protein
MIRTLEMYISLTIMMRQAFHTHWGKQDIEHRGGSLNNECRYCTS